MRALKTYSLLAGALIVWTAFALGGWSQLARTHGAFGSAATGPAPAEKISTSNAPTVNQEAGKTDVYEFSRHLKAILHSPRGDQRFVDFDYQGQFYVTWTQPTTARISFELKQGLRSAVSFEITLDHWVLTQMKAEKADGKEQEDSLQILKDFSSILAWHSTEDTTGKYETRWLESNGSFTKQKTTYLTESGSALTIQKSKHFIQPTTDSKAVLYAKGMDMTTLATGKDNELRTSSEYTLVYKGRADVPQQISAKTLIPTNFSIDSRAPDSFTPWSQIQTRLESFSQLEPTGRLQLFHSTVKTLKYAPSVTLRDFLNWANPQIEDLEVRTFSIGVLASLGSFEAQKKLMNWYQTFPESRIMILNAFTTSTTPFSEESRSFLTTLSEGKKTEPDVAYSAMLALGTGIKNAPTTTTTEAEQLETLLHQSNDPVEKEVILDAMGNSGNTAFIPSVEKSLDLKNEEAVREKAVMSMRLMPIADTQSLVNQAWNDPSLKVKTAVLQVIQYQNAGETYQNLLQKCGRETSSLQSSCQRMVQTLQTHSHL